MSECLCNKKIVPPTESAIEEAARILKSGGLVAFPTETVYGLGANALDPDAVAKIFKAKGRPQDNPLILHVSGISECELYAELTPAAEVLMHQFWPGPLTIVLYAFDEVPPVTRGGLETVALRSPLDAVALDLIRRCGFPLAAPSANRSGRPSTTTPEAVLEDLGDGVDLIIDGGPTSIGLESTVVDATGDTVAILRPGGITREMLSQFVDLAPEDEGFASYRSPGNLHRHYMPKLPLMLWDCDKSGDGVFVKASGINWCYMGISEPPGGVGQPVEKKIFDSVEDYAHRLFTAMREFETTAGDLIVAEMPADEGLGRAIRNRLQKASGGDQEC